MRIKKKGLTIFQRRIEDDNIHTWEQVSRDVVVIAQGKKFTAHKNILAQQSEFFRKYFRRNIPCDGKKRLKVVLNGFPSEAVEILLNYTYTGTVYISEENVLSILSASRKLKLQFPLQSCCEFIARRIDFTNCMFLYERARHWSCRPLEKVVLQFVKTNILDAVESIDLLRVFSRVAYDVQDVCCLIHLLASIADDEKKQRATASPVLLHLLKIDADLVKWYFKMFLLPTVNTGNKKRQERHEEQRLKDKVQHSREKADAKAAPSTRKCQKDEELQSKIKKVKGIMIIGGVSEGGLKANSDVFLYMPSSNQWGVLPPMAAGRYNHGVCYYSDSVCVAGGSNDESTQLNSVEIYNPELGEWVRGSPMIERRGELSLVQVEHKVIAIGGHDGSCDLNTIESCDLDVKQWSTTIEMVKPQAGACVAVERDLIYIIGGFDGYDWLSKVLQYDVTTNEWRTFIPSMHERRAYACSIQWSGKIIVMGGFSDSGYLQTCESYDVIENTWSWFPSMSTGRTNGCASIFEEKIFVFGGECDAVFLDIVEMCNLTSYEWTRVTSLPHPSAGLRCLVMETEEKFLVKQLLRNKG